MNHHHHPTTTSMDGMMNMNMDHHPTTTGAADSMMNMNMDPTATNMDNMMDMNMNMNMNMAFHTGISDVLYSESWKPTTTGQYVGACIFLVLLAVIHRFLAAFKGVQEAKWRAKERKRVIIVAGARPGTGTSGNSPLRGSLKSMEQQQEELDTGEEDAVREKPRNPWMTPWRFSTELPRAGLATVVSGVGYLLYVHPVY